MTNVKLYDKIIFMKIVTDCKRKFSPLKVFGNNNVSSIVLADTWKWFCLILQHFSPKAIKHYFTAIWSRTANLKRYCKCKQFVCYNTTDFTNRFQEPGSGTGFGSSPLQGKDRERFYQLPFKRAQCLKAVFIKAIQGRVQFYCVP